MCLQQLLCILRSRHSFRIRMRPDKRFDQRSCQLALPSVQILEIQRFLDLLRRQFQLFAHRVDKTLRALIDRLIHAEHDPIVDFI